MNIHTFEASLALNVLFMIWLFLINVHVAILCQLGYEPQSDYLVG